jgi:hypothetical protein
MNSRPKILVVAERLKETRAFPEPKQLNYKEFYEKLGHEADIHEELETAEAKIQEKPQAFNAISLELTPKLDKTKLKKLVMTIKNILEDKNSKHIKIVIASTRTGFNDKTAFATALFRLYAERRMDNDEAKRVYFFSVAEAEVNVKPLSEFLSEKEKQEKKQS